MTKIRDARRASRLTSDFPSESMAVKASVSQSHSPLKPRPSQREVLEYQKQRFSTVQNRWEVPLLPPQAEPRPNKTMTSPTQRQSCVNAGQRATRPLREDELGRRSRLVVVVVNWRMLAIWLETRPVANIMLANHKLLPTLQIRCTLTPEIPLHPSLEVSKEISGTRRNIFFG